MSLNNNHFIGSIKGIDWSSVTGLDQIVVEWDHIFAIES
jgi:hypothetical protein